MMLGRSNSAVQIYGIESIYIHHHSFCMGYKTELAFDQLPDGWFSCAFLLVNDGTYFIHRPTDDITNFQAHVLQRLDGATQRINHYPLDENHQGLESCPMEDKKEEGKFKRKGSYYKIILQRLLDGKCARKMFIHVLRSTRKRTTE